MANSSNHGTMIMVTGLQGDGKTTFCQQVVQIARRNAWAVAGVLGLAVVERGAKVGIEVEDVQTGERRRLARRASAPLAPGMPQWEFEPETFEWGNQVLRRAPACDLLVVDEVGPLEFYHQRGWQAGLAKLDEGAFRLGLVVVRPDLVALARERWPHALLLDVRSWRSVEREQQSG